MSRRKKPKKIQEVAAAQPAELDVSTTLQRNVDMFSDWMAGATKGDLATKYDMHVQNVYRIAAAMRWDSRKTKILDEMHANATQGLKSMHAVMLKALERDMQMIVDLSVKEKRMLTSAERDHFTKLCEQYRKEIRLEDGKPTEINNDTRKIVLVLPPGHSGPFGIIPPDPSVTFIEAGPESKDEE